MMLLVMMLTTMTAWAETVTVTSSTTNWTSGNTYAVNSNVTINDHVTVTGSVTLSIASGCTLNVNSGITVNDGGMLTVTGSGGTLNVSGSNGEDIYDAEGHDTGDPTDGSAAIDGNLTVNSGTVTITGGKGGDNIIGNTAADGGDGIHGNLTVNGGTVTVTGGTGGHAFYGGGGGYGVSNLLTVNDGNVTVYGGESGGGDGAGCTPGNGVDSHVTVNGGFVLIRGGVDSYSQNYYFYAASGYVSYADNMVAEEKNNGEDDYHLLTGNSSDAAFLRFHPVFFQEDENTWSIYKTIGWELFCDALQNNDKGFFDGKTVKLCTDIAVTRMAGASYHDFTGTFDGQGHTLTFTYNNPTEAYAAPFRYVEGTSETVRAAIQNLNVVSTVSGTNCRHLSGLVGLSGSYVDVSNCNVEVHISSTKTTDNDMYPSGLMSQCTGPVTISGCTVTGEIATNGKYAAGILAVVQGSATIASITNCVSSVTINSSTAGDGTHGGFVAVSYPGSSTIEGCLFNGKLLTVGETATGNCGGFIGWGADRVSLSNCLYAPASLASGESEVAAGSGDYPSRTFGRDAVGSITNCYFTRALGTVQGKQQHSITAGENVTVAHSGTATEYTTSGITAYKDGNTQLLGLKYGDVLYAGENDQVSLTLNHSEAPTGYSFTDYEASNGGTITGTSNPYTLTLPNEDVTVSTTLTPNTYYVHFDGNGNTGGSMADQTFHYDEEQALSANAFTYANHTFIGWSLTPSLTPNENDNENENNSTIFADQESILNLTATDGETIYLYAQWILTPVPYIDQNGEQQFCTDYTVITEDEEYGCLSPDHLEAGGWYIFDDNLSVDTYTLSGSGAANIILVDGANYEIGGLDGNIAIKGSLNIYGQSNGTGNLELKGAIASHSSETDGKPAIQGDITLYGGSLKAYGGDGGGPSASQAYLCANGIDGSVTIYGGSLTSEGGTPFYYNKYGSCGISGNVTFYGGSLTAKGFNTDDPINDYEPGYGIGGNVTLSWTNTTDRFYANSIRGTVTVAQGKAFTSDGTDLYCGSVNPGSINGKTLSPAVEVTLACGLTPGSGIISLTPDPSPAGEGGNENHYYAKVGQTVTVAVPSTGCTLDSITPNTVVLNDNGDGTYSFTVPAEDVIVSGGDRTAPVHSDNDVWVYGTLYQDACLACFDMDLFLPQDQDLFDDCSPMTITHTDTRTGNDRDGWTIRRDYEVTDACGNTLHEFIEVSGRDQTPPMATNPEMKKDTLWAYAQCLCDSIRVINDLSELKTLFGLSDECTGDDISLVSKTRTFKIGNQGNHCPDTVVVAYTVADTYNNQSTFYHAQLIQDTTGPTFSIVPLDTSLCVDPDGDYVATVQRVAATATIEDIHDNCTRLQGNITVSAPTINFDPSENDNGGYTTDDNGIRTYYQVWSVTDSCGNTTRGTLEIHLYPLATIRIDSLDNQTITYGEDIKEVEVHSQYANVSVPDLGASDGITFSGNRLMGQPSAAGTYVYHPTATSWYECNSVETSVTVKVNPRPITITAASAIKKYDGKPLTSNDYICTLTPPFADMYYRILVGNDSIASVTITDSQTNVGTSQNVPRETRITITTEPTADKSPSYAISYGNGTLEVIKNDTLIRVIPGSGSKVYDGTPFTMTAHDDFTVTGVPDGLTWTATADGTVTNVIPGDGEKAVNAVTSFRIFDFNNVDVTNYFTNIDISATGTLRVIPSMLYLADNADNTAIIGKFNGQGYDVTLQGRTLWKDGNWNTLCLPFDLTAAQVTTQLAPSELKELDVVNTYDEEGNVVANGTYQTKLADDGTLYLYFTDATEISAGTPYIIKWNATTPDYIENPTFKDVVIDKDASTEVTFTGGKFVGSYSPVVWQTENQSVLFLGADNKLYWPQPADADHPVTIGAFRAYFDLGSNTAREFRLFFGDDETQGIISLSPDPSRGGEGSIYTLNGVKLDKMPTRKGLYIYNGNKVVIK